MEVARKAEMATADGPSDYFTGKVYHRSVLAAGALARRRGDRAFRTGRADGMAHSPARPDLDRHGGHRLDPCCGRADPRIPRRRHIVVPPEHEHWHGTTPHRAMTHIAIPESLNGSPVTWMEKVTDEQYNGKVG